jgi:hypothetical protein
MKIGNKWPILLLTAFEIGLSGQVVETNFTSIFLLFLTTYFGTTYISAPIMLILR